MHKEKIRRCWGCSRPLYFRLIKHRVVAFEATTHEPHNCPKNVDRPPIFIEAMADFSQTAKCDGCGQKIYEVPTRYGTFQFDESGLSSHKCRRPEGIFESIWNMPLAELQKLPRPHQIVVIVCVKKLLGNDALALIASKSILGRKFCDFFFGGADQLKPGDLAALCGNENGERFLATPKRCFKWDSRGEPKNLNLPSCWLQKIE